MPFLAVMASSRVLAISIVDACFMAIGNPSKTFTIDFKGS